MNKKVLSVIVAGIIGFTSVVPGISVSAAPNTLEEKREEYEKLEAKVQGINEKSSKIIYNMKKQNKRGNENGIKRYKSSKDEIQKNENGRNGRTKRNRL